MKVKVLNDGRLVCPKCPGDIDVRYEQTSKRLDSYVVRFDPETERLFMIDKPKSETLTINGEYLRCDTCRGRFEFPWSEYSMQEQDNIAYEGDFLRMTSPDEVPLNECPLCRRNDRVTHLEQYDISRDARSTYKDRHGQEFLLLGGENKIEFDGGGEKERLQCQHCFTQWSMPRDVEPMV